MFDRDLYKTMGQAGILGINYPEALGGTEGDLFQLIVANEEIMRSGSGGLSASLFSHNIGLPPIANFGNETLKQQVVPQVLSGEKICALAITEPGGGSDVANLKTRAIRDGDIYRVSGSKTFITSGTRADYYTVAVRTGSSGHQGVSLLMIEKDTPGFTTGKPLKKMGWWASDTCELFFDNCEVPATNLLGEENQGFKVIMANFQKERLMLTVMAYMTAQLALEQCLDYVKERSAFDSKLADIQVIRHKLADMATQVEIAREYAYRIAARMDAGENVLKEISMAKNFATDVCDTVTHEAVQIFGGMGYMRESLVERL